MGAALGLLGGLGREGRHGGLSPQATRPLSMSTRIGLLCTAAHSPPTRSSAHRLPACPRPACLPLQVNSDGVFRYASSKWFSAALQRLAATGIRGVAVDVWVRGGGGLCGEVGAWR